MNIKIKILSILNLISYLLIGFIYVLVSYEYISNLVKLIIGTLILVLILLTSFVLADDMYKELVLIKSEARVDWISRVIAFSIILIGSMNNLANKYLILISILILMIINFSMEYNMNKKLKSSYKRIDKSKKDTISYEEKCNLGNMIKATNLAMISFIIFCGFSISIPILKNMEGTEKRSYIPVIVSIVIAIWFIKISYSNYMKFYLDKSYGKKIFIRNGVCSILGYIICLALSFGNFRKEMYDYFFFIGIIFTIPTIITMRKMSLRLKEIRDSIGKDNYNYYIINKKS